MIFTLYKQIIYIYIYTVKGMLSVGTSIRLNLRRMVLDIFAAQKPDVH